jgi:hypothetical protein
MKAHFEANIGRVSAQPVKEKLKMEREAYLHELIFFDIIFF